MIKILTYIFSIFYTNTQNSWYIKLIPQNYLTFSLSILYYTKYATFEINAIENQTINSRKNQHGRGSEGESFITQR